MESADDYHRVVAHLNDGWRVIVCGDGIQWVLQSWRAPLWRNRSFCMTCAALRREARKVCSDSAAWQTLLALPEQIKDARGYGPLSDRYARSCARRKYQTEIKK